MTLASCDRFSDLSPDEIHRTRRRLAAALGVDFAALLDDPDSRPRGPVELRDSSGPAPLDAGDGFHRSDQPPGLNRKCDAA